MYLCVCLDVFSMGYVYQKYSGFKGPLQDPPIQLIGEEIRHCMVLFPAGFSLNKKNNTGRVAPIYPLVN